MAGRTGRGLWSRHWRWGSMLGAIFLVGMFILGIEGGVVIEIRSPMDGIQGRERVVAMLSASVHAHMWFRET
eukprot:1353237-Amorphochlora_amoeboformis.AAC.1